MNKAYKYTLTANEHKEITFDVGVNRLAISNANGTDGDITIVTSEITKTDSGDICSFVDGADAPFADFIVNIEAVQSGSGDPSPTNVRPITGWTGCDIIRSGKNLLDPNDATYDNYTYRANGETVESTFRLSSRYYRCSSGDKFTISRNDGYNIQLIGIAYFDANKTFLSLSYVNDTNKITATTPNYTAYIRAFFSWGTGNVSPAIWGTQSIQLEKSDSKSAYEPYNGETFNIDWEDEGGTVYGGELNVKTGVLVVTHANIASYDGETINEPWISSMDVYSAGATPTTGAQVVYPLTTPVIYQLTPVEIRSLLGVNNVWADCGDISLKYFVQSTQPLIDYIDDKTENVVEVFKATNNGGDVYTLDDITCDELCLYARTHSNIVLKVARYNSTIAYDIFILSDYIGTSAVFRHTMITSAIGGGYVLYVRELQADSGTATNVLTTRGVNITVDT